MRPLTRHLRQLEKEGAAGRLWSMTIGPKAIREMSLALERVCNPRGRRTIHAVCVRRAKNALLVIVQFLLTAYQDWAERAEQWLHKVYPEIEDRFLRQEERLSLIHI